MNELTLYPPQGEWTMMREQSSLLVKSGFLPRGIDTPEKAIAIMLKGRELGIPPMQAFAHISIVEGKPTMSAELMRAQVFRLYPTATFDIEDLSNQGCTILAGRPGKKATKFHWGPDEARAAGLLTKQNWQKYPKAMYLARATSEAARALFADALMGVSYTYEELKPDDEVDEGGSPIPPAPKKPTGQLDAPPAPPGPVQEAAKEAAKPKGHPFDIENAKHRNQVTSILVKRKIPQDQWAAIMGEMKGRLFTELEAAIQEVAALAEAEGAQVAPTMDAEYQEAPQ